MKILSPWPWPQGHPQSGDGADTNFRPISTIMPNMNEIHQRVFKIWGLINFNAKTLTLWRKDERTNIRMNKQTEKRKHYTPTYFVCRGYNNCNWRTSCFVDLCRYCIWSWSLARWQDFYCFHCFIDGWEHIKQQITLIDSFIIDKWWPINLLCWGLTAHQPLWVILCHLPEKGRRDRRDSRRDERDGQGRKRYRNEIEETEEIKTFPLYPYLLHG